MEEMVSRKLDAAIRESDMCRCEQCRLDVMALTLNKLPPRYVVGNSGNVYVELELNGEQGRAEIITALVQAIERVNARPRHPESGRAR